MSNRGQGTAQTWLRDVAVSHAAETCLEWPFHRNVRGYASIRGARGKTLAHREVCRIVHGEPPTRDHQAAHACHNRACCNPRHLRWATPLENMQDKAAGPNYLVGSRVASAKLTEAQALEILASSDMASALARRFGVSNRCVRSIKLGVSWPHLQRNHPTYGITNAALSFGA